MKVSDCKGLRGFAIHRTDHEADESFWLQGMRTFAETDPGDSLIRKFSSRQHPFQDFVWSDYSVELGRKYTYRVVALKGTPSNLVPFAEVRVTVETEAPSDNGHIVCFNRGAASSQQYASRFGNKKPTALGDESHPVWTWLSRGNRETIIEFIRRAKRGWGLRVCAYEFRLPIVAEELKAAIDRGADVKILFDGSKDFPAEEIAKWSRKRRLWLIVLNEFLSRWRYPTTSSSCLPKGKKQLPY